MLGHRRDVAATVHEQDLEHLEARRLGQRAQERRVEERGDLGGGAYHSIVRASSDSGLVSCGWGTGSNGIRAVRFTNGLRFDLGDFPGGPDRSYATDISANGQIIVGNGSKFGPDDRAFKVGANNVLVELPILPNTTTSNAAAVNGDGSIIAGTCVINAGDRAVRWNGMQIQDLGLFPGAWNAQATAIDPSGRFVAGVASTNQGAWAWLWDNVNGMRRIDNVMSLDGIFAPGWKIERISDIRPHNNDELNMVGWGVNPNGENEAFFLRITMPPAQRLHGIVTLPDLASTEGRPLEIEVRQNGDVKYSTVVPVVDLGIGEYGTFEVLPDLPAGTYQVSFRYGHYLRRTIQANLTSGETLLYPDLINGDVTQDNVVDSDDFDQLVRQFGTDKESSGENWVGTADLNEDDRVDSDDFDILVVNFGQYGDQ